MLLFQKSFSKKAGDLLSSFPQEAERTRSSSRKVPEVTAKAQNVAMTTEGTFEGYASVFNAIDQQNDAIAPGAFTASLAKWKNEGHLPKLLWQHDPHTPVGLWDQMEEDEYGLFVRGHLLLNIPKGREAYILLKEGVVDGLSIGFLPRKSHHEGRARVIDQVDLFEVSLVTFMANPLAYVTSCKERTEKEDPAETKAAVFGATVPLAPEASTWMRRPLRVIENKEALPQTRPAKDWTEDYRSTIRWMTHLRNLRQAMDHVERLKRDFLKESYL